MRNFEVSACSTMDVSLEQVKEREIKFLNFKYYLDGVEHFDDMFATKTASEFYGAVAAGAETKTSQVNVDAYIELFRGILSEGKDLLHLVFSSGLSGSYNSAKIAADEVRVEFPDRKLFLVDTLAASSGFGLFVDIIADMRDEGKTIEEAYEWAEANKLKVHHWFTASDLTAFVKGGRISKAAGWFGTILKICPVLNMSYEGKLVPREKARGKANALKRLVEKMEETALDGLDYNGKCYISNSDCQEDAEAVKNMVEQRFANLKGKVKIFSIGATIGSHTGRGTTALFYMGKERID